MNSTTKADRFKRLAGVRVNRAIRELRLIGNLANSSNYEYTDQQVAKIVAALTRETRELKRRFALKGRTPETSFEL